MAVSDRAERVRKAMEESQQMQIALRDLAAKLAEHTSLLLEEIEQRSAQERAHCPEPEGPL